MTAHPSTALNKVPWPPLVLFATFMAAIGAGFVCPLPMTTEVLRWSLGLIVACAGVCFDVAAILTLRRHRANIRPDRAATLLVTGGPFAISRNPIYLGNTLLLLGAALLMATAWLVVAAAASVALVSRLAIEPEERHLAARFGEAYLDYCASTPRWLRIGAARLPSPRESRPS